MFSYTCDEMSKSMRVNRLTWINESKSILGNSWNLGCRHGLLLTEKRDWVRLRERVTEKSRSVNVIDG